MIKETKIKFCDRFETEACNNELLFYQALMKRHSSDARNLTAISFIHGHVSSLLHCNLTSQKQNIERKGSKTNFKYELCIEANNGECGPQ